MKRFYTVLLALLLACFVSCSNGDDDTDDTPVSNSTSSTTITDNTSSSSSTTDSTTTTETTGNNGSSTTDSNNTSSTDDSNSTDNTTTTSGASYNFATAGENDDILAVVSTLKNGDTLYISGKMTEDDVITLANAIKTIDEDEILINLDMSGVTNLAKIYEDENTKKDYTFSFCYALSSVILPDSVVELGRYAFFACKSLTSITGKNVRTLDWFAFAQCTGLTEFTVPKKVTWLGRYTFQNCSNLETITIGVKVTDLGYCTFGGCDNLKTVNYEGTIEQWKAVVAKGWGDLSVKTVHCSDGDYL